MPAHKKKYAITDLIEIMERLLGPGGCPWDREQTPKSLTPYAIEEAHELAEAIEEDNLKGTVEELGDLLLQVIFHSCLGAHSNRFTFEDVLEGICHKLIRRHPHVFADSNLKNADEVLKQWNEIKAKEKGEKKKTFDVPLGLPALQRAQKIGDKTKNLKFDWQTASEVMDKVNEETQELKEAIASGNPVTIEEELGDVFFVFTQLARHLKIDAEAAARKANKKFENRFAHMLGLASRKGLDFQSLSLEEKENLWQQTKIEMRKN